MAIHYPRVHFEIWRSLKAGEAGTKEKHRIDPLDVPGPIRFQPFAGEIIEWYTSRA
jgi:hypothetical protein